jgi:hypothetical protein
MSIRAIARQFGHSSRLGHDAAPRDVASRLAFSPKFAEAVLHRGDEPVVIAVDELYELLKERMKQRVSVSS